VELWPKKIRLFDAPQLVNGAPGVQEFGFFFKLLILSRGDIKKGHYIFIEID
jgi:hypothetical protein